MKKQTLKKLELTKTKVVALRSSTKESIKGGATEVACNSVPRDQGGIGCHLF